jgi:hypothetical protein
MLEGIAKMAEYNAPKCRFNLGNLDLEIGDIVYFDSPQGYTLTAFDESEAGKTFLHWKAPCKSCGKLFDTTTARGVIGTGVKRNCDKHKGNRFRTGGHTFKKDSGIAKAFKTENRADPAPPVVKMVKAPPVARPKLDTWCSFTNAWRTKEEAAKERAARGYGAPRRSAEDEEKARRKTLADWEKAKAEGIPLFDDTI